MGYNIIKEREIKKAKAEGGFKMTNKELVEKIYFEGQVEGTEDGLYIRYEGKEIEVKFNNDDIREYLGTDAEGEELLDMYQARDEEIDKHFMEEQIEEIKEQLER